MEIIIGGYNLDELKKVQNAVKKDASAVISTAIKTATEALENILSFECIDESEPDYAAAIDSINVLAKVAEDNLKLAQLVSGISGVEYYLPYSDDYDSEGFYYRLEGEEALSGIDSLDSVMSLVEDMEYQSRKWNQSTC